MLDRKVILKISLAFFALAVSTAIVFFWLGGQSRPSPYPPSPFIAGITWDTSSEVTLAPGSDLWPMSWAADNNVYGSWGDGGGFGGTNSVGRVSMGFARLEGQPPAFIPRNVNGGINSQYTASWNCDSCGKTAGIISVNGIIYAWVNMQNAPTPDVRLAWSADLGKSWNFSNWKFPDITDQQFLPATFLNFGKDNSGARDKYVYSYGARWTWTQGKENSVYLSRVAKNRITHRPSYEFFKGFDAHGKPLWAHDITQRHPVFTDTNGVGNSGLASVIYNQGIGRYLMTVAHRPPGEALKAGLGQLGIFDAPEPWGPWTTVWYYDYWLGYGSDEALVYAFPTKWISADGLTLWMAFSGYPVADNFNLIKATLTLHDTR